MVLLRVVLRCKSALLVAATGLGVTVPLGTSAGWILAFAVVAGEDAEKKAWF